jgi:hypothetical protein
MRRIRSPNFEIRNWRHTLSNLDRTVDGYRCRYRLGWWWFGGLVARIPVSRRRGGGRAVYRVLALQDLQVRLVDLFDVASAGSADRGAQARFAAEGKPWLNRNISPRRSQRPQRKTGSRDTERGPGAEFPEPALRWSPGPRWIFPGVLCVLRALCGSTATFGLNPECRQPTSLRISGRWSPRPDRWRVGFCRSIR